MTFLAAQSTRLWLSCLFLLLTFATARQHHMFVGSAGTPMIFGLTYDDISNKLTVTQNNTTRQENSHLALSWDARTLYSSGPSGWSSFPVQNPSTLGTETMVNPTGNCNTWNGVFVLASKRAPYSVYGSLNCANAVPVTTAGVVRAAVEVQYNKSDVSIFGMGMDPQGQYLYSADWSTGKLWSHQVDVNGDLTVAGCADAPSTVSAPRTVIVHPSGRMMYVVLEAWNVLAAYAIDPVTRLPVYTGATYMLVSPDADATQYGSKSASLSSKGSILYATAQSHVEGKPGFLTAFQVGEDGSIQSQLFQTKTPTSGGKSSNVVAAAPWNERVVALMEDEQGSVSIWKWDKDKKVVGMLAKADIGGKSWLGTGCCSGAVWVD